tara:strand:- start:14768 stop:15316 length:549 start_codon:yes stop_codon:yes gene_type:complete
MENKYEMTSALENPYLIPLKEELQRVKFVKKNPNKDKTRTTIFGGVKETIPPFEAFALGLARAYNKKELVQSAKNRKYPDLYELCKSFIKYDYPDFEYTTIQLNKNVNTEYHFDARNGGVDNLSACIGIGDFTEGGIEIKENDIITQYPNKDKWLLYNGKTKLHRTIPAIGDRFAIIYFTKK